MTGLALIVGCGGPGGCGRDGASAGASANANGAGSAVSRVARRGPVTITLSVDRARPRLSDRVRVRVVVQAQPDVTVEPDDYGARLRAQPFGFRVEEAGSESAVPDETGVRRWTQTYDLTFLVPGRMSLPPASVRFIDERRSDRTDGATFIDQRRSDRTHDATFIDQRPSDETDDATGTPAPPDATRAIKPTLLQTEDATRAIEPTSLQTEGITLDVRADADLSFTDEQLGQITMPPPRDLPVEPRPIARAWGWVIAAGVVVCALAVFLWTRRRRRREAERPGVAPHEWARDRFARLLAERLVESGRVREFYFRLSGIVREYVERRFDLHVPEMTTEEFLRAALAGEVLGDSMKAALGRFLEACDRVKFALYLPDSTEVDESVQAALGFVERTRPRGPDGASDADGGGDANGVREVAA